MSERVTGHFTPVSRAEGRSKDVRLRIASEYWEAWCACTHSYPRDIQDFTKENLGWEKNSNFPEITCKASDCNLLVKWLLDYLSSMPVEHSEPEGYDEFARMA